jgi:acyl carrier protein
MLTKEDIKRFIVEEFMPDTRVDDLPEDIDLISAGVIDSLAVLKIVAFIEMENDITIAIDELSAEKLNCVASIFELACSKTPI